MTNKLKNLAYWGGVGIVAGTHIYMLFAGLPENQMIPHAIANLVAVGLYTYHKFG